MAVYQHLAVGGTVGFISTREPKKFDVSSLDKYFDAAMKARAYLKDQEDKAKPDLSKYKDDLKGRAGDVRAVSNKLSTITSNMNTEVAKAGGSWLMYSATPEYQKNIQALDQWQAERSTLEHNLKTHEAAEVRADNIENGIWARQGGEQVYFNGNGVNTTGNGIPITKKQLIQYKWETPSIQQGTIIADSYDNEDGSFKDVMDAMTQALDGLGHTGYETNPALQPLVDGLGGYVNALTSTAGSDNYQQVASARAGFINALKTSNSRAYNGMKDAFTSAVVYNGYKQSFDNYVDQTVNQIVTGHLDSTVNKQLSAAPKGNDGGGDAELKKSGYFNNLAEVVNGIVIDTEHPKIDDGFDVSGSVYKSKKVLYYDVAAPPKGKDSPFAMGAALSNFSNFSLSTPTGYKVATADKQGFLTGEVKDQRGYWGIYDDQQQKWRLLNQEETDEANLAITKGGGPGKGYDPQKYKMMYYYKIGVVMPGYKAKEVQGVTEADMAKAAKEDGARGTLTNLYSNKFLRINGIEPAFAVSPSTNAKEINKDDDVIKAIKATSAEATAAMEDKWYWPNDGNAVQFDAWIEVDPTNYRVLDTPYDQYHLPANSKSMAKIMANNKSWTDPSLLKKTLVK